MEKIFELGSDFYLDLDRMTKKEKNVLKTLEREDMIWTDSGRSAIKIIQKTLNCKKVLLPEYICESVIKCFDMSLIEFYHIDDKFQIDLDDLEAKMVESVDLVYICHYYGYLQDKKTLSKIKENAKKFDIIILEDITQSLFSIQEEIGDYLIASVRKWVPIANGGVLYTNENPKFSVEINSCLSTSSDNDRVNGMILKKLYLDNRYDTNYMYRKIFQESEERIDHSQEIKVISDFSKFVLKCTDIDEIISRRKRNAEHLKKGLDEIGLVSFRNFNSEECPFAMPIRVKNRDDFRKYLISKRIYCAVHWPFFDIKKEQRRQAKDNAKELLSLPIDQRYTEEDMDYLLSVIKEYGGELIY